MDYEYLDYHELDDSKVAEESGEKRKKKKKKE